LLTIFLQNSGDFDDKSNGIKFKIFSTGKTHKKQKVCIVSYSFSSITVQTNYVNPPCQHMIENADSLHLPLDLPDGVPG
jgi:hypothetical protein